MDPGKPPGSPPGTPLPERADPVAFDVGPGEARPKRRGPVLIEEGPDLAEPAASPADAPPVPETGPAAAEKVIEAAAMPALLGLAGRRGRGLARLVWSAAAGLAGLALTVAAWDFVTGLLARNAVLGAVAGGLLAVVALGLLVWLWGEGAALGRLRRIDRLRAAADAALAKGGGRAAAEGVLAGMRALYAGRADLGWARQRVDDLAPGLVDADALIDLAEREYLAALDARAAAEVEAAARRVALVTAMVPIALADIAVALVSNIRMIRRIAEIYGGRAGSLGSWRLLRAVAGHLVATGAVAVGDDLVGAVLGGGVLSRLSRRFGEGVVNAALTARVGVAAMEVCRPLPFRVLQAPGIAGILRRAVAGVIPGNAGPG